MPTMKSVLSPQQVVFLLLISTKNYYCCFEGHGDSIIKYCLAHAILKDMENGSGAQNSTRSVLEKMTAKLNNTAGIVLRQLHK